jgi:hypothetical protein
MYVRHKVIKGHTYYYLVRGERQGGKVKQKVVRYLGKSPGAIRGGGGGSSAPPKMVPMAPAAPLGTTPDASPATALERNVSEHADAVPKSERMYTESDAAITGALLRREAWRRFSDHAAMRFDVVKVQGGISWQLYENDQLLMATLSARPYRLGQPCDGTIDTCVHALFILWCRATGHDPQTLYHKAYGDKSTTTPQTYNLDEQEEKLRHALDEGIEIPTSWSEKAFQGLLDSLTEINLHALVQVLEEEPAPPPTRHVTPALSTAVMNRERARMLVDQALTDLNAALAAGNSDALTAYLDAMARFPTYSLRNQMSIASQCPHATIVAGFREWKKRGRYVRKGEKGILITAPIFSKRGSQEGEQQETAEEAESTETVIGYRPVYVFDVSQTEGEPLSDLKISEASGDPGEHTDKLKAFVAAKGITLEYTADLRYGVLGSSYGGRIRVREGLSPVEEFTTLVHEVAHELLHHTPAERTAKTVRETEAEAVSHVVSSAIGLQTTHATADYIRLYRGDVDTLRASLETIRRTANAILEGLEAWGTELQDS